MSINDEVIVPNIAATSYETEFDGLVRNNFGSPYQNFDVAIYFGIKDFSSNSDKLLHVDRIDEVPQVIMDESFHLNEQLVEE